MLTCLVVQNTSLFCYSMHLSAVVKIGALIFKRSPLSELVVELG